MIFANINICQVERFSHLSPRKQKRPNLRWVFFIWRGFLKIARTEFRFSARLRRDAGGTGQNERLRREP